MSDKVPSEGRWEGRKPRSAPESGLPPRRESDRTLARHDGRSVPPVCQKPCFVAFFERRRRVEGNPFLLCHLTVTCEKPKIERFSSHRIRSV